MLKMLPAVLVLGLLSACWAEEEADPRAEYAAQYKGRVLDNIMLADVNGNPQKLVPDDYDPSKPLVVNLWATWCTPCVKEMPSLYRLQQSGNAYVIAVTSDRKDERVRDFLAEHNLKNLNVRWDKSSKGMREAGMAVPALPVTFILRQEGEGFVVKSAEMGEREWDHPKMLKKIMRVFGE